MGQVGVSFSVDRASLRSDGSRCGRGDLHACSRPRRAGENGRWPAGPCQRLAAERGSAEPTRGWGALQTATAWSGLCSGRVFILAQAGLWRACRSDVGWRSASSKARIKERLRSLGMVRRL